MNIRAGQIVLLLISILSGLLWVASKTGFADFAQFPLRTAGQLAAILAVSNLSLEFLLSTRLPFLDKLFGGLDKTYKAHHLVGGLAFSFMLVHVIFLILGALSPLSAALIYILPSANLSYTLGVISLLLFIALLTLTFYIKLPYHTWKNTHTFLIVPLIIAGLHVVTVTSDVSRSMPLRIWVILLLLMAVASYIYTRFLRNLLSNTCSYSLRSLEHVGDFVHLTLHPSDRKMTFKPGQFAFITFQGPGFNNEAHPFSMTSDPSDKVLTFTIKMVGDWTKKLSKLKIGTTAIVRGPYGDFWKKQPNVGATSLWIAGGIGITPFMSMLHSLNNSKDDRVCLYYLTKNKTDAVLDAKIRSIIKHNKLKNITYVQHNSDDKGRLAVSSILEGANGEKAVVHICGPKAMMTSLCTQFFAAGVNRSDLIFEEFEL